MRLPVLALMAAQAVSQALAGAKCSERADLQARLLKAHNCDSEDAPQAKDICLLMLGEQWLTSLYTCEAEARMYEAPDSIVGLPRSVMLRYSGDLPLPDNRRGSGDEVVWFGFALEGEGTASVGAVPVQVYRRRADIPISVQVDTFIENETVAREWTGDRKRLSGRREDFLARLERQSPPPEAILSHLRITDSVADSASCPAVIKQLEALEATAADRIDVGGIGEDREQLSAGRPLDELPMAATIAVRTRFSRVELSNVDPAGPLYAWAKETLAALEQCWRSVGP